MPRFRDARRGCAFHPRRLAPYSGDAQGSQDRGFQGRVSQETQAFPRQGDEAPLKPLDEHLAALPNPALNPEREAGAGFAEQAQEVADWIAARGLAGAVWAAEPGLYGVKISGHFRVPT